MKYLMILLATISMSAQAKTVEVGDHNPNQTVTCSKSFHIHNCN